MHTLLEQLEEVPDEVKQPIMKQFRREKIVRLEHALLYVRVVAHLLLCKTRSPSTPLNSMNRNRKLLSHSWPNFDLVCTPDAPVLTLIMGFNTFILFNGGVTRVLQ